MKSGCAHLEELRQELHSGHWPTASSPELRAHVGCCRRCTQEVALTIHLRQARLEALDESRPEPASLIWWRAQARRREAVLARATRPIVAAQAFAVLVVLAAIAVLAARNWRAVVGHALAAPTSIASLVDLWGLAPMIAAATLLMTLGAVAVYLTTDRR